VKDVAGKIHSEGKIGSTRRELDSWIKTLPEPRMIAMEATIFHRLDLRSLASSCRKGEGSPPTDAAGHCCGEAEERQDRCQQDRRLSSL
jgi:hypothetical protein